MTAIVVTMTAIDALLVGTERNLRKCDAPDKLLFPALRLHPNHSVMRVLDVPTFPDQNRCDKYGKDRQSRLP